MVDTRFRGYDREKSGYDKVGECPCEEQSDVAIWVVGKQVGCKFWI